VVVPSTPPPAEVVVVKARGDAPGDELEAIEAGWDELLA
jgi:hypothetical protein